MTAASPRTLVVGGGPAGLAVATALSCHRDVHGPGGEHLPDLEVVDPAGAWLRAWHRRFAAQAIPHLRSPAVHHPHPDPFALLAVTGRDELTSSGGTSLPSARAFARFCDRLVLRHRLHELVTTATAVALEVDDDGAPTVHLTDGTRRRPDRVVLATNARRPAIPPPFRDTADPRVRTGDTADVRETPTGGKVVVVGGGLSAAHLAVGAAERGAEVTLLTRRRLRVRRFDTHPSWLGPKRRRPFEAEPDAHVRRRTIDAARGGGSIPHAMRRRLDGCVTAGRLQLLERRVVTSTRSDEERLVLELDDGTQLAADAVWLATGGSVDVASDPLCRRLVDRGGTGVCDGMPDLAPDLSWPGTRVHLVGAVAALVLGPTAGNLVGHRRAAQRILAAIDGRDPARADRIATGTGACPRAPSGGGSG